MTDAEIAEELERVFSEMPGMRRCFETWRGIGLSWGVVLTEAEFNKRFYELLCQTERRAQEHRARGLADMAAEALAESPTAPVEVIQIVPAKPALTPVRRIVQSPQPAISQPTPLWKRPENQGQL